MDIEMIKSLLELMDDHELQEIVLEEEGRKVKLSKKADEKPPQGGVIAMTPPMTPVAPMAAPVLQGAAAGPTQPAEPEAPAEELVKISAPMVGTFYRTPAPDADPFVDTGDHVEPETVVCIIEAMKVMNEIKAETAGTIVEVLVENGEAIEYGQPLFLVKPDEVG